MMATRASVPRNDGREFGSVRDSTVENHCPTFPSCGFVMAPLSLLTSSVEREKNGYEEEKEPGARPTVPFPVHDAGNYL